ncbi:LysR family transcriptional regulator [Bradyrhizobium sp. ARR65]|uniref:LysR family transcriptional regulator n=1 Tax=Bradyrhizobium sp. ARR65 TaxID=1040989 RepID=UPI00046634A4|nr:LysR family transcriptional regulator [Bradyrhizobium sp. ARR65]
MDLLVAMRVYVRVVERGSMSAAARDLGMGQPAVSERIERLESHLGTRLLRRNTRKISLTDAGVAFYERSKHALEVADDAVAAVAQDAASQHKSMRGRIRMAAPHGVGEVVLPPLLLRLRDRHPHLKIDLVLNDRVVDPVTEGVDISLRLGDCGEGSFVARRLGHVRRVLVAAPDYLLRHGRPAKPAELIDHPFVRVTGLFNNGQLPLVSNGQQTEPAPIQIALNMSHWRPVHALLLGGAGIGVLQEPVCTEDLASGRLTEVLPEFAVPGFDLHALYPAARPIAPRIRAVLSLLEEHLPGILR